MSSILSHHSETKQKTIQPALSGLDHIPIFSGSPEDAVTSGQQEIILKTTMPTFPRGGLGSFPSLSVSHCIGDWLQIVTDHGKERNKAREVRVKDLILKRGEIG